MRKLISTIFAICAAILTGNAREMSESMKTYVEGCMLMREAIATRSFETLTDARIVLSGMDLAEYSPRNFAPADSESAASLSAATIYFSPDFADEMIKRGEMDIEGYKNAHVMRKGEGNYLRVWHASIKPQSRCSLKGNERNEREMLLLSASGSKLRLEVRDHEGNPVECEALDGGSAWLAQWTLPAEASEFTFSIINEGDETSSFVIATN